MTLLEMSSTPALRPEILEQIYDEVIDHMKRSGVFDEIRVGLIDPVWSHPEFKRIIGDFEAGCARFCHDQDLNQPRNDLRQKMQRRFHDQSSVGQEIRRLIMRILSSRKEDLESEHHKHAETSLKRFLPQESSDLQQSDPPAAIDMDIDSSRDSSDEIERPSYSPLGHTEDSMSEIPTPPGDFKTEVPTSLDDLHLKIEVPLPIEDCKVEIPLPVAVKEEASTLLDDRKIEAPISLEDHREDAPNPLEDFRTEFPVSLDDIPPPPDVDSDELEKLTLSSVSSIKTSELMDFDDEIKLSDDEADIVGKPANSKIPTKVLSKQLVDDLQVVSTLTKATNHEETEQPETASESDGGCSETTTARRAARARKSNPRYSSEHFKL